MNDSSEYDGALGTLHVLVASWGYPQIVPPRLYCELLPDPTLQALIENESCSEKWEHWGFQSTSFPPHQFRTYQSLYRWDVAEQNLIQAFTTKVVFTPRTISHTYFASLVECHEVLRRATGPFSCISEHGHNNNDRNWRCITHSVGITSVREQHQLQVSSPPEYSF